MTILSQYFELSIDKDTLSTGFELCYFEDEDAAQQRPILRTQ